MEQLFNSLPSWVATIVIVVPTMVGGGFFFLGLTDKKAKERSIERQAETDALQENIKRLYKEEAAAQDEKIKDLVEKNKQMGERLATLEGENKTFRSVLTGSDEQSKAYRLKVEATLTLVDKLAEIIVLNGKKTDSIMEEIKDVNHNIQMLAEAIKDNSSRE